jgi:hypothetical protein
MWRHGQAKLGDGLFPVGKEALTELGVRPRLGHDPGAIAWNPLLLGAMRHGVYEWLGFHPPRLEDGFDCGHPPLD